ncbi:hypothetical protein SAMN05518672_10937 [Chitinophaga sp. CF118]|uniref:hypothetical protein n=1 Tax=Chitinophaga sp. CF118 TaxID=1884367 RepID=UPI0008DFF291|nr:hypothetical protein [Chitinophaga sp. CF118]SFE67525.1 hypothetical protein SAMN05518672_10937 [Chitinophaga sp. CF118]
MAKDRNKMNIKKKKSEKDITELAFDTEKANITENQDIDSKTTDIKEGVITEPEKDKDITSENSNISETAFSSFTFEKPVYLQIHVGNIYSIFGSGIVAPAEYISNRAFVDVQTIIPNGFILSNSYIENLGNSVLLLDINFAREEYSDLTIENDHAYYFRPIPISRIKCMYASDTKVKNDIILTALSNDGGIIPDSLVVEHFPAGLQAVQFHNFSGEQSKIDYSSQLLKYDKVLGTFAFLKNYSLLLSNRTNALSPIPDHYLYAIQALNDAMPLKTVKNDRIVSFYEQLFNVNNSIENPLLNWLFQRVALSKNFSDEDIQEFQELLINFSKNQEFTKASINILQSLSKSLERKNVLSKILSQNDADKFSLYLFALLRSYANINSENKSISRLDMPGFIALIYGEYVFALLGYFFGYKTLRNHEDRISISDPVFARYIDSPKRVPMKFEMTTMLDYVVIESIFRNCFSSFSSVIDTSFIEAHSIKKEWIKKPEQLPNGYTFKAEEIFGKYLYLLKKESVLDQYNDIFSKLPSNIPVVSEVGIFCFRNGINRHYGNFGEIILNPKMIIYFIQFKKEDVIEAAQSNKLNIKELIQRIELSNQHKEW